MPLIERCKSGTACSESIYIIWFCLFEERNYWDYTNEGGKSRAGRGLEKGNEGQIWEGEPNEKTMPLISHQSFNLGASRESARDSLIVCRYGSVV